MAHRLVGGALPDLEPLSPRDANARRAPKLADVKHRAADAKPVPVIAALKAASKEKDHPPPPPALVFEPPCQDKSAGDSYEMGKLLGKGGFAVCYIGSQKSTNFKFALKVVKKQMPPKMEQKFQTELQIHSKMRQENIVQFFRAFSFQNSTYLVLELCPNGSLMDMVKRRKGITEPEVKFYTVQIAGAIKYMHSKGIIHRDLKMGNIFLDAQMNAKIGDFGLAALLVTGKDMQQIRRTTLCGTPNYIAPEILEKGRRGHDHTVDVWSLGIIVFAMLTSKPPFQSSTTDEIYRRARERDYEWPMPDQKIVSSGAKALVSMLLQEPDNRPTPDEVASHHWFEEGYFPEQPEMRPKYRDTPPESAVWRGAAMDERTTLAAQENFRKLCDQVQLGGRWVRVKMQISQVWKEVAAEESAGLTPIIPLADDVVYRPFHVWLRDMEQAQGANSASAPYVDDRGYRRLLPSPSSRLDRLRQPQPSFAALQRAQSRPTEAQGTVSSRSAVDPAPTANISRPRPAVASNLASTTGTVSSQAAAANPPIAPTLKAASRSQPQPSAEKPETSSTARGSHFNPNEKVMVVPDTKPDEILTRLRQLHSELERALNSRTMAFAVAQASEPPRPSVVIKWVDYTNKFGLGYILNDGSVGCVLRDATTMDTGKPVLLPPACMLVHDAEEHIQREKDVSYEDRKQIVPMTDDVHFYEHNGEHGLAVLHVSPEKFRVAVKPDGTAGKLPPGKDEYEHRKRERIILWKKFANYMIANGRDELIPVEEPKEKQKKATRQILQPSDVVIFYQRFGDVGCWVFCDGHLQFNFPDHTKIVLSATGQWCHFWHLPKDAAETLAETGSIGVAALDERAMLSYPLQTLLNFNAKPTVVRGARTASSRRRPDIPSDLQGIPVANDFRRKIEFIKVVVGEWVTRGGMGNSDMSRAGRLKWTGYRETAMSTPMKHVWVTVGARNGDQRHSCYVDPREPTRLMSDIDESKKRSSS